MARVRSLVVWNREPIRASNAVSSIHTPKVAAAARGGRSGLGASWPRSVMSALGDRDLASIGPARSNIVIVRPLFVRAWSFAGQSERETGESGLVLDAHIHAREMGYE